MIFIMKIRKKHISLKYIVRNDVHLTHLPLNTMAAISQTIYTEGILPKGPYLPCVSMAGTALWQDTIHRCIFVNEKLCIEILLKFVPKGPFDNNLALV